MNILICGGLKEANYTINAFKNKGNNIVVINDDEKTAKAISEQNKIDVYHSDPTKKYSLEVADIYDFDLVIALTDSDTDNFVICKMAKELFHIKKAICTVSDPEFVEIFMNLGIDTPISAPYLLTQKIKGESDIESIMSSFTLEENKVIITEITIKAEFACAGIKLKELNLPVTGNVTCIYREPNIIIPRGDTDIKANDHIYICSSPKDQKNLVNFMKRLKR